MSMVSTWSTLLKLNEDMNRSWDGREKREDVSVGGNVKESR